MLRHALAAAAALAALGLTTATAHAVPTQVSFAGRLADADGPVDGSITLSFRVYEGTTVIWQETHPSVSATGGLVFAAIGSVDPVGNPLDAGLLDGAAQSLEIVVNGQALAPRLDLLAVPYAVRAGVADTADTLGDLTPGDVALADHDHAGAYVPVGTTTSCAGASKVTGIDPATGNVTCAADANTTYTAGAGLSLAGTAISLATGGVTAIHLATGAVTSVKLADGAVTANKILAGSVDSSKLANGAVIPSKLAANAVTNNAISDGAVTANKIFNGSITTAKLANDAVTTVKIDDGAVTSAKLAGTAFVYRQTAAGCEGGVGALSISTQCTTAICVGDKYKNCAGQCSRNTPEQCTNLGAGQLVTN